MAKKKPAKPSRKSSRGSILGMPIEDDLIHHRVGALSLSDIIDEMKAVVRANMPRARKR